MEKHFDFRKKLMNIHRKDRVCDDVWKKVDGVVIDESWTIFLPLRAGKILAYGAKDLQSFFEISMNRRIEIVRDERPRQIRLKSELPNEKPSYRICVNETVEIVGSDEKMTAQGIYALEDQMCFNEGPVLKKQNQLFTPMFSPRIIHTGLGDDLYPDEHLCAIAHAGMDGIMVYTHKVLEDPEIRENVNDIIARAGAYGIGVYTFPRYKNLYHPDDPGAREYYDSTYGELIRCCPGIKGLIMVGETCEFPSHDPRTTGKTWRESLQDEKPSPGWYPCCDYPKFAGMIQDVVNDVDPDVQVIFWSYNWGYVDAKLREEMIRAMPQNITMMSTFEMFERFYPKADVVETCTDYTLWFPGPGAYARSEMEACAKRGIKHISMSNTGGNTWDIGDVPYLPAPGQWMKRYQGIVDAHKNLTLTGLMESHTYGFWPSFLLELAKAAYTEPQTDLFNLLRAIAVRDYGENNADTVLAAWDCFNKGMEHCVSTNEDQYGPCRIGPSYPLFFKESERIPIGPESSRNPNATCTALYRFNPDLMARLEYEIEEYEMMVEEFAKGNALLRSVIPAVAEKKQPYAREALTVSSFIENTARTAVHVKKWHKAKIHLGVYMDTRAIWTGGRHNMTDAAKPEKPLDIRENREEWITELMRIGEAEIRNAEATIPLVRENSRLGYTQELDYVCSEEQLRWKINRLRKTLDDEIRLL